MNDAGFTTGNNTIRVLLDADIMQELIYGDENPEAINNDRERLAAERKCALREHQLYRLMRSMVSQFNGRLKGRRERFKLVDEGNGLVIEISI